MEAKLLSTATIGKTHGLEGYLRVYSLSGEYSHLKKLDSCIVSLPDGSEKSLEIEAIKSQGDLFLFKFKGYDAPEKARVLTRGVIMISRDKAPKLKKGEYYIADLYNMDVMSAGEKVGEVVSTAEGAQSLLLEVKSVRDGKIHIVPLLDVYVSSVDVKANTLELLVPELLD